MSKQQEKQIKLVVSPGITTDDEIRLGKLARENLGFINQNNDCLEIWSDPFISSRLCETKKAFSKDLKKIQVKDKKDTCFVSQHTYDILINSNNKLSVNKQFWISSKKNTCVGSDPEFIIFTDIEKNKIQHASDVLAFESPIGSDGVLGELRALPGLTSEDHVDNIGTLIKDMDNNLDPDRYKCRILPFTQCLSGPNSYRVSVSCGGHIHFGLTKKITKNHHIYDIIVNLLDRTLAVCMQRLDSESGCNRRTNLDYGLPGDYKNDVSLCRLEYRALSATWLLYKDLANIVLGISSNFIEVITSRISKFSNIIDSYDLEEGEIKQSHFITNELFPEISPLMENNNNNKIKVLLEETPTDSSGFRTYIETALECMSQFTNSEYFEPFTQIVLADNKQYENLDPDFITNWNSNISVFDHIKK